MPKEATQRLEAATTVIGPKDTHPDDVCVNSDPYLQVVAVTYNPDVELRQPHRKLFEE